MCAVCHKWFRSRLSLDNHLRVHSYEKPFSCTDCGQLFTKKGNLKRHMLTHGNTEVFREGVLNRFPIIIYVSTEHLKWCLVLRQMRESMLCQTLHVCIVSDTRNIQSCDWPKWCCALWRYIISCLLSKRKTF